jgi:Transposase-associated domain
MRLRGEVKLLCPCCVCQNFIRWKDAEEVKSHLIRRGFKQRYTRWTKHGEYVDARTSMNLPDLGTNVEIELQTENVEDVEPTENINFPRCNDELDEMMHHVLADFVDDVPDIFENLHKDSNIPLFPSCTKYTKISAIFKLYNLKAKNNWSNASFTSLFKLLGDMLLENNVLSEFCYVP